MTRVCRAFGRGNAFGKGIWCKKKAGTKVEGDASPTGVKRGLVSLLFFLFAPGYIELPLVWSVEKTAQGDQPGRICVDGFRRPLGTKGLEWKKAPSC